MEIGKDGKGRSLLAGEVPGDPGHVSLFTITLPAEAMALEVGEAEFDVVVNEGGTSEHMEQMMIRASSARYGNTPVRKLLAAWRRQVACERVSLDFKLSEFDRLRPEPEE